MELYEPFTHLPEPYEGYLVKKLGNVKNQFSMNTTHIAHMDFDDVVLLYPISNRETYLGTMVVGPMALKTIHIKKQDNTPQPLSVNELDLSMEQLIRNKIIGHERPKDSLNSHPEYSTKNSEKLKYQQSLPMVQQFQIQYLCNLLNLVMGSTYYDPTIISTLPISEENKVIPSAQKISSRLVHHSIDQEEKILQQILVSNDTFAKLATKYISKLSNLVAPPLADHPIRSEKNRFIVSATIVSRAAIKLGLPSDFAFSYSDYYINEIESCDTLEAVWDLQMSLFSFFREEVKKIKSKTYFSSVTNTLLLYIENNIDTTLSLQEICQLMALDYKYASNCFKKDTGLGFNKYLTKMKMEVAKKELETSDEAIQTIAENLGFNSAYYFTRTFTNTFGISPSEFRKRSMSE